jgi:hypothetical protein
MKQSPFSSPFDGMTLFIRTDFVSKGDGVDGRFFLTPFEA